MRGKILLLFLVLLLIFGCTPDTNWEEDENYTSSGSSDSGDGAAGLDESGEDISDDPRLEDYLGAVDIVEYSGWVSELKSETFSLLSEYWDQERDEIEQSFYSFDAIRVFFEDGTSNFYMTSMSGRGYYTLEETSQQTYLDTETSLSVGPGYISFSGVPSTYPRIGIVDYDGEIYFSVSPGSVSDNIGKDLVSVSTYDDGTTSTSTHSFYLASLGAGGGSTTPCIADSSDRVLSNPGECLAFISADGSFAGTFSDNIYDSDDNSRWIQTRTISWYLYPLEDIVDDVPIGNEEEIETPSYSETISDFASNDEGFIDWVESTY